MGKPVEVMTPGGLLIPNPEFGTVPSDERIAAAAEALESNGFRALVVDTGQEARLRVAELPEGAEVTTTPREPWSSSAWPKTSKRSGRHQAIRLRLYQMDREMQRREMQVLAAAPEYVVGGVHAVAGPSGGRHSSPVR